MEYQLELTPFQILLNLEMYSFLEEFIDISIEQEQLQKIKNSVKILDIDKKKCLTKSKISYFSQKIKSSLVSNMNRFFGKENILESHLEKVFRHIIKKSQTPPFVEDFCNFIKMYLKEISNTLIIDYFSDHFSGLIKYIIKMGLRNEYSGSELKILINTVLNNLLGHLENIALLKKYLDDQFWTSSRHLYLVSNEYNSLEAKINDLQTKNDKLIKKISNKLPSELINQFQKYLNIIWRLNTLKLLDSQVQIRAA
ncbi:MAG: hypothetical protein ACOC4M_13730, partial [Promethearchaeia archaeon]